MSAMEAILAAVPAEYRELLGAKSSAKEAWEAIAAMHVGYDRAKKATAQPVTNLGFYIRVCRQKNFIYINR